MRKPAGSAFFFVVLLLAAAAVSSAQTTQQRIDTLVSRGIYGATLQNLIVNRARGIMAWNRPYTYDGVKDCYGYCRQVENAVLYDGSSHSEDYTNYSYTRANYWLGIAGGIPVNTYVDPNWASISSLGGLGNLLPGDLVGTSQGHTWGSNVHYGMVAPYNGGFKCFQCGGGYNGAYETPWYSGFTYYYKPLHAALAKTGGTGPVTIVIDNANAGFTCSTAWATGTSSVDKYGTNYRYHSTAASSDPAKWSANITAAGNYTIYAWWPAGSNRSTTAPYLLPGSTTSVKVNQQINGGNWNTLGTVSLATGTRVTQLSFWTTTGFVVVADAIKLYKP